jgi:hypothetical protein
MENNMNKKNIDIPDQFEKVDYNLRDEIRRNTLEEIFTTNNYSYDDILRNWPAYVLRRDIPRFLAHYELFKQVIDLPGCIVELGVFKGVSFFTWSNLLETFCSSDRYKKVFGFDHFEGLKSEQFCEKDGKKDESVQKMDNGYKCTAEEVRKLVRIHNDDNLLPGTQRCQLIEGDIMDTLPKFLEDNPGLKISLLHFDMDIYEPTKYALELLYPLVVKGGIVCFDEYGLIPWQGETKAVDEYFESINQKPVIKKFPFYHVPAGYIIK